MNDTVVGILTIGVPALLIGGILLGRYRPVFWMFFAALVVGLGYLTTTGAVDDVGKQTIGYIGTPPPDGDARCCAVHRSGPRADTGCCSGTGACSRAAPAPEAAPAPAHRRRLRLPKRRQPSAAPAPAP